MSCQCKTKTGKQCKLSPQAGKLYCHIHKLCTSPIAAIASSSSSTQAAAPVPPTPTPTLKQAVPLKPTKQVVAPKSGQLPFSLTYIADEKALKSQIAAKKTRLSLQSGEIKALVQQKSGPGYGLMHYVGNCYETINTMLANPTKTYDSYDELEMTDGTSEHCELELANPTFDMKLYHKIISDVDSLFKQVTPLSDDLIVYRGSRNQPDARRFVSTSLDPTKAVSFAGFKCCLMIIKIRKGSRVVPVYACYAPLEELYNELYSEMDVIGLPDDIPSENEVILSRNGNWQLLPTQFGMSDVFGQIGGLGSGDDAIKIYFYEYWN